VTLRRALRRTAVLAAAAAAAAAAAPATASAELEARRGHIVLLHAAAGDVGAATELREDRDHFRAAHRYRSALRGFAADLTPTQVSALRRDPGVAAVTLDTAITGNAKPNGKPVAAAAEVVPAGVRRIGGGATAAGTGVAVIDTGLDLEHPDLTVAGGVNCVTPGASHQDDNGHGTHVGGTIAGRDTGTGVVGVAPGTRLYAVKVLNARNAGTVSSLLCGLDWVARNAAALDIGVANMSVGGPGTATSDCGPASTDAQHIAICNAIAAGVSVVASAGNSGVSLSANLPAAYPEVLAVSGMTDTDGIAGGAGPRPCLKRETDDAAWTGSNYGVTAADAAHLIAAPAVCVVSAQLGGGTSTMTGTSMAAPHVAGAMALCIATATADGPCAALTPAERIAHLRSEALAAGAARGFAGDPFAPVAGKVYGPLVDARAR
jgi:subtilisin family serine protease